MHDLAVIKRRNIEQVARELANAVEDDDSATFLRIARAQSHDSDWAELADAMMAELKSREGV